MNKYSYVTCIILHFILFVKSKSIEFFIRFVYNSDRMIEG